MIATVGSAEKALLATAAGADHVINYNEQDFVSEVARITNGSGVHAVFGEYSQRETDQATRVARNPALLPLVSLWRSLSSRPCFLLLLSLPDGVGASTFAGSLKSLRKRGTLVTFGNASGPVPPIEPLTLTSHGSVFLTRPTVGHFIEDRAELEQRTNEVHQWLLSGQLKLRIATEFPLAQAKEAHEALESRKFAGKILLNIKQ